MDNIDTAKGISDIVPMQDLFNEWHAKNTSDKVKRVLQSRGNAGIPLTTNLPYGYMKSPEDRTKWEIDEPAAEVVRQIFRLCVSGLGPTQIAKRLKADKVPTPTEYWQSMGRKCGPVSEISCNWCCDTIANILDKQEYVGDTVNFRSYSRSFKLKRRIERPQAEWKVFPGTHPAIIDRETFELVQQLRQHRRRPAKTGAISIFSGLLYCADCGKKLYYSYSKERGKERTYFFCSSYRKSTDLCTAHYIQEWAVKQLVLESLQRVLWYVQVFEKKFAQEQMERLGLQQQKELAAKRRELDKAHQRVNEIDLLIQKSYEGMTKGLLSEERFAILSLSLENEQKRLKNSIPEIESTLQAEEDSSEGLQRFIDRARKVTRLTELTPEIVHEFIEKIVVHNPEMVDGKRHQKVDIHYSAIGLWCAPGPEEMEELFQAYWAKKQKLTA